jgi:hypothetical protein
MGMSTRLPLGLWFTSCAIAILCLGCGGGKGAGRGGTPISLPDVLMPQATTGTLMVAIQDTLNEDLSELWITVTEVVVTNDTDTLVVFPPSSAPLANRRVNLIDGEQQLNLIASFGVPQGLYREVSVSFDGMFARSGGQTVTVLPDAGQVTVEFAPKDAIVLRAGGLTTVLLDFGLEVGLVPSGERALMFAPTLKGEALSDELESPVDEFGGKIISVNAGGGSLLMELHALQDSGDSVPAGELQLQFDDQTVLSNGSTGLEGLRTLKVGNQIEVEGVLQGQSVLAVDLEVKTAQLGEDLDDDGVEDRAQFPDHDTDIDNDGIPNVSDLDDDGDGEADHADLDNDNDGVSDPFDHDDDGDGLDDDVDLDDDGDGVLDVDEGDNDNDGIPDESDPDDDNDGVLDHADPDDDNDGVNDSMDNCPGSANPTQDDHDADGIGNVCDESISGQMAPEPVTSLSEPTVQPVPVPEPKPTTTVRIDDVHVWALSPTVVAVRFDTDRRAMSTVLYGSDSFGAEAAAGRYETYHTFYLRNLKPNRNYTCKIQVTTRGGQSKTSGVYEVRTTDLSSYRVRDKRPRLLVRPDQISGLKSLTRGSHDAVWSDVVKGANSLVLDRFSNTFAGAASHHNPDAVALAVAFLITGDQDYVNALDGYANYVIGRGGDAVSTARKRLPVVAIAYDTLYNVLSSSERNRLRAGLEKMFDTVFASQNFGEEGVEGHAVEEQGMLLWAAIALYDSGSSKSKSRLETLLRHLQDTFLPVKRYFAGVDGGSANGWYYATHSREFPYVLALMALDNASATTSNLVQRERTWLEPFGDWLLYGLRGDYSFFRKNDNSPRFGFRQKHYLIARFIAKHFKSRRAQWLANFIEDHNEEFFDRVHRSYDLLTLDTGIQAARPSLPTSKWFRRVGVVMMRESWDAEAVVAQFTSSERYTGGHQHLDDLSFAIYYKGGLALDGGVFDDFGTPHHEDYYQRTIAHNSITVVDPNEVYCRTFGSGHDGCTGDAVIPNDGGQIMPPISGRFITRPRNLDDLVNEKAPFRRGGVPIYEDTEDYTYSLGRGAPSYNEDKVKVVDRHFLFLKSVQGLKHPVMVVFDHLDVNEPDFRKIYHLHAPSRIALNGNVATIDGVNISTGARGVLHQRTLLPKNANFKRFSGGEIFTVDGDRYSPRSDTNSTFAELEESRLEILAPGKRRVEQFLNVLYATDRGDSNPSSSLVSADGMFGVAVKDWIVLFAPRELSKESTSYTANRAASHALFGFRDGRRFDVLLGGKRVLTVESSKEGTLRFDLESGGAVKIRPR